MKLLLLAVGMALMSCTTSPKKLSRTAAVVEYETSKSPALVRDCILNGWLEELSSVTSYETSEEFGITHTDPLHNTTVALVTISKSPSMTKVKYFHGRISMKAWQKPVEDCKAI